MLDITCELFIPQMQLDSLKSRQFMELLLHITSYKKLYALNECSPEEVVLMVVSYFTLKNICVIDL